MGTFEAGIIGLEDIFERVLAARLTNEESVKEQLLSIAREHGNYISSSSAELYKVALFREFILYCEQATKRKMTSKNT